MMVKKRFICSRCGHVYSTLTGDCYLPQSLPQLFSEVQYKRIQDGVYGGEVRDLLNNNPNAYLKADTVELFMCECGNWRTEHDIHIYEPRVSEKFRKQHESQAMEVINADSAFGDSKEFKEIYHKEWICGKCGKNMKIVPNSEEYEDKNGLMCPECEALNMPDPEWLFEWD